MSRRKFALLNKTDLEHSFSKGTHWVGDFKGSLNDLRKMLGKGFTRVKRSKLTIQYSVLLDDLTFFTLYDYKSEPKERPYNNPDLPFNWHIGAKDELSGTKALLLLQQLALEKL